MKLLILILITLAIGAAVASLIIFDQSYVNISLGNTQLFENNITVFVLLLIAAIAIVYYLLRFIMAVFNAPDILSNYSYKRNRQAAVEHLNSGFVSLVEHKYAQAERHFIKGVAYSDVKLVNYLNAAKAAAMQHKFGTTREYLNQLRSQRLAPELAILFTEAEIALEAQQVHNAKTAVDKIAKIAPKHEHLPRLQARLYYQLADWQSLTALLPQLKKNKKLSAHQIANLELEAGRGLIEDAGMKFADEALNKAWGSLPRMLKKDNRIVSVYIAALLAKREFDTAETIIRQALNKNWSETLIEQYSQVELDSKHKLLEQCQKWAQIHHNSANLFLTMARLAASELNFSLADEYYRKSLQLKHNPQAKLEQVKLLKSLHQPQLEQS